MKNSLLIAGLSALLLGGGCQGKGSADDDANEATVSLSAVPQAVRASFEKMHPNATVHRVEKETHANGRAEYEFEFTQDGKKGEVELDEQGAVAPEDQD